MGCGPSSAPGGDVDITADDRPVAVHEAARHHAIELAVGHHDPHSIIKLQTQDTSRFRYKIQLLALSREARQAVIAARAGGKQSCTEGSTLLASQRH